jgi:hypothetical protein
MDSIRTAQTSWSGIFEAGSNETTAHEDRDRLSVRLHALEVAVLNGLGDFMSSGIYSLYIVSGGLRMPMTMVEFEKLAAAKPAGTPLAEIIGVSAVYWSGSLVDYIYLVPEVMGKPAAIVPASLKARFGATA